MANALATEPYGNQDSDVAFAGKSKSTIYRVFLKDLFQWVGAENYSYNKNEGTGFFSFEQPDGTRLKRDFYCFGYSDADSHERISGSTFGLAYLTEGIFCHEDFHKQMMARLSIKDARLFGDTNPAGPHHWLYKKVIANPDLLKSDKVRAFLFNFYSNRSLEEEYRESLRLEYGEGSLWYQRLILGLWVMAEGVIYADSFREDRNVCTPEQLPREFDEIFCALDYGTTNPFNLGLFGEAHGKTWLIDEWDHDSAKKGQRTNSQYLEGISEFLASYSKHYKRPVSQLIVDPSAASFKADLLDLEEDDAGHRAWRELGIEVVDADNEVEPGIKTVSGQLHRGDFVACTKAKRWLAEAPEYAWCPNAQKRGLDVPLKRNDHACDMVRYALHTRRRYFDAYAGFGLKGMIF